MTPASMPRARVRMLRCGCTAASAREMRPWRSRVATRLWSSVTWVISPSESR